MYFDLFDKNIQISLNSIKFTFGVTMEMLLRWK